MKRLQLLISGIILVMFSCVATKKNTEVVTKPCVPNAEESCVCPQDYDPECGCNNKTYINACHAMCSNVTYVEGKCKDKK